MRGSTNWIDVSAPPAATLVAASGANAPLSALAQALAAAPACATRTSMNSG